MENQLDSKGFEVYAPYSSACSRCAHFSIVELNCDAFPDIVPDKFLSGERIHEKVEKGQTGDSVFKPI